MSNWRRDLYAARDRDPAARNALEVAVLYPGVHAIWAYRLAHWLWVRDQRFLGRAVSQIARGITGIEIHPGASIGPGLFIALFNANSYGFGFGYYYGGNYGLFGFGARMPLGLNLRFSAAPIEVYLELDPMLLVFPGVDFNIGASLGFRWFF